MIMDLIARKQPNGTYRGVVRCAIKDIIGDGYQFVYEPPGPEQASKEAAIEDARYKAHTVCRNTGAKVVEESARTVVARHV